MRTLASTVHVYSEDTGQFEVFLAGSTPPAWAQDAITNEKAWATDGGAEETGSSGDSSGETVDAGTSGPPPKSGKGSGRDPWAAYAAARGVYVGDDDTRDDIIAACVAAGVPTE